jgi:hypothetical protein
MASVVVALAMTVPADAQGKGKKSKAPSSSPLPTATSGASPLSWVDDASLLAPGMMSLTVSTMRWSGADLSEVDFPIVDAAVGLTSRVQLGASVPRIVGSADGTGPVGGVGTSYITSKIALLNSRRKNVKLALAPMIKILGESAVQGLAPDQTRTQFGLPLSMEMTRGSARVFASTGFFWGGAWFAGGGAGVQATPRLGMSLSFSRAWTTTPLGGVSRDRHELSGGASYSLKPQISLFGSMGRTIATADENGAGTTISGGITFLLTPSTFK